MIKLDAMVMGDAITETEKLLAHISNGASTAIVRGINRGIESARTEITRSIADEYFIGQARVRETFTTVKAKPSSMTAMLISKGSVPGIQNFKLTPKGITKKRPAVGIRVQVRKDGSPHRIPGTFFISGKIGLFRSQDAYATTRVSGWGRKYSKSDRGVGIERVPGPAVPSMMEGVIEESEIQDRAAEVAIKEMTRQVDVMLIEGAK